MPTTTAAVQPGQPPQRAADGLCIHRDYIAGQTSTSAHAACDAAGSFADTSTPRKIRYQPTNEHRRGIRRFDWYTGYYTGGRVPV